MNYLKNHKKFFIFIVSIFFGFVYFVYQKSEEEKIIISKINQINILDFDIDDIENKINTTKNRISQYQLMNKGFFERGHEAEELYNLLSQLALNKKLLIENISKGKIKKFLKRDIFPIYDKENPKSKEESKDEIIFSKVIVDYRITGRYEDYMEFRESLAEEKKIISIDYEEINIGGPKNPGQVGVNLTISTYRMGEFDYAKI